MRVLVSGASGLIGSALAPTLESSGHSVVRLVRRDPAANEIRWDPAGGLQAKALEGLDAVVHLAGESIAGRWTAAKKARIRDSRVLGTTALATALARTDPPARVLVCASAIGIYGDRADEVLREESAPGSDLLAEVANQWEAATESAARAGVRVVSLRFGVVLSPRGGALARMLPPFRMGAGGRIGSGRQWMSWITLDDIVGVIQHTLAADSLRGPVNTVAPSPVTNAQFTRALGEALHRPTIFPLPAFMVRLVFGEMGEALLLSSQRVDCGKLLASGYRFRHPELKLALEQILR
ncbi:MAG TPA: TIGR01777 family oxidoreductase [Terriglobales bacterium]|nr:TIGR01777 family oxidoreductase [Terriglobales bacterium]